MARTRRAKGASRSRSQRATSVTAPTVPPAVRSANSKLGASIESVFERTRREEQRGGRETEAQDERQGEQGRFDEGADR